MNYKNGKTNREILRKKTQQNHIGNGEKSATLKRTKNCPFNKGNIQLNNELVDQKAR